MTEDITSFIRSSFPSVWALELMIYMRERPEQKWTADELVTELRGSPVIVDVSLQSLISAGMAAADEDGRFFYKPNSPAADRLATAAAEIYRLRPDAVRRALLADSSDRIQALADAFRLRRD